MIDALWGEEPPRTALTSSRTRSRGCASCSARAPRHEAAGLRAASGGRRARRRRARRLVDEARGAEPADRVEILREAERSGAGRRSPSSLYEASRRRRSRSSRSFVWRRRGTDRRRARARPARRSSSASSRRWSRSTPPRAAARPADARALPRGASGRRLHAYQDARRSLLEELGIEPGPALQRLHGAILGRSVRSTERRPRPPGGHCRGGRPDAARRAARARARRRGRRARPPARRAVRLPRGRGGELTADRPVRRAHEGVRAALRRAARAARARGRPRRSTASSRRCRAVAPGAWRAAAADRDDELRPRARGGLFAEAGEEFDVVSYLAAGTRPRQVLPSRARGNGPRDRRPQHVRDRARPGAADRDPEAPRGVDPRPRAGVGELRRHRGRLHRLPPAERGRDGGPGGPGRAPAAEPLPLPRLRRCASGTCDSC